MGIELALHGMTLEEAIPRVERCLCRMKEAAAGHRDKRLPELFKQVELRIDAAKGRIRKVWAQAKADIKSDFGDRFKVSQAMGAAIDAVGEEMEQGIRAAFMLGVGQFHRGVLRLFRGKRLTESLREAAEYRSEEGGALFGRRERAFEEYRIKTRDDRGVMWRSVHKEDADWPNETPTALEGSRIKQIIAFNNHFLYDGLKADLEQELALARDGETAAGIMDRRLHRAQLYAETAWVAAQLGEQSPAADFLQQTGEEVWVDFAGADDSATCKGCERAMNGSPYRLDAEGTPIPGMQDCFGNCRHALIMMDADEAQQAIAARGERIDYSDRPEAPPSMAALKRAEKARKVGEVPKEPSAPPPQKPSGQSQGPGGRSPWEKLPEDFIERDESKLVFDDSITHKAVEVARDVLGKEISPQGLRWMFGDGLVGIRVTELSIARGGSAIDVDAKLALPGGGNANVMQTIDAHLKNAHFGYLSPAYEGSYPDNFAAKYFSRLIPALRALDVESMDIKAISTGDPRSGEQLLSGAYVWSKYGFTNTNMSRTLKEFRAFLKEEFPEIQQTDEMLTRIFEADRMAALSKFKAAGSSIPLGKYFLLGYNRNGRYAHYRGWRGRIPDIWNEDGVEMDEMIETIFEKRGR